MLHEEYRPKAWADFIGNGKAVTAVRAVCARAVKSGRPVALLIQGASGTGKTTLAQIVAGELTTRADFDVVELDGDKCSVGAVRALETEGVLCTRGLGGFRVVIVNECHAMSRQAVQAWLTLLERLPAKSAVIFTTTEGRKETEDLFGNFSSPFLSRCIPVSLTNQGLAKDFAERAKQIAEAEGLGGADDRAYLRLVQDCKNNFREVLSRIEAGEMFREAEDRAA